MSRAVVSKPIQCTLPLALPFSSPSFLQSPSPLRSLVCDWQPSPHSPRLVVSRSKCPLISPPPPRKQLCTRSCSNKQTHTHKEELLETVFSVSLKQTRGEDWHERASVSAQGTGAVTRCLLTHPPDAISISSALKEHTLGDIYVLESVSGQSIDKTRKKLG
jgi:hypothetical protein